MCLCVCASCTDIIHENKKDERQTVVRMWVLCISLLLTVFVVILLSLIATKAIKNELQRKKTIPESTTSSDPKNIQRENNGTI
jgi:predicted nucleic acid-binding Zn ribbon protein